VHAFPRYDVATYQLCLHGTVQHATVAKMVLLLDDTEGRLLLMAGNNYTSNRKQYSSQKEE
jgi:hypothetical protein